MSLLLTLGLGASGTAPTPPTGGNSPYMSLLLPTVSVTLGPLYATEVNNAFLRVDGHDHSPGYGKLIGTNGLNINGDLSFHGNKALNLDQVQFNVRSPSAGLTGGVYMSGQDLYCVDGAGNVIQITAAGAVNVAGLGSWTGLTAPAQAQYNSVTKKFSLLSNTTGPVYGLLAVGDILLYPGDPNLGTLPYIRVATPNAGVTTYTMFLPTAVPSGVGNSQIMSLRQDGQIILGPTLPSATSFLRMGNNGALAADVVLDQAPTPSLLISGGQLKVNTSGIQTSMLASGAVTADKLVTATPSTVTFTGTGVNHIVVGPVALTAQSSAAYPTTNARPILVSFGPTYQAGVNSLFRVFSNFPNIAITIRIDGGLGAGSATWNWDAWNNGSAENYAPWTSFIIPPGTISAGAHTWTIQIDSTGTNFNATFAFSVAEL